MVASPAQSKPKSWLWRSLTSIRLTVFLLLILAAVAVLGTVVPQDLPLGQYLEYYGEGLGGVLYGWGLARIYYSPWFLLPVGLLAVNILACVVQGLPRAIRRSFRPFTPEAALTLPERGQFSWPAGVDPEARIRALLREELGGGVRKETLPDQEIFLVQRGRLRPLGPYLVHLAILLILAGALIGKFWGIEGTLPLDQGESAQTFQAGHTERPLNFQVRLDKFQVQFYKQADGTPKEFRSDLTFLKDGVEAARAVCRVNEPVTFGGLTFYQASYGASPAGPVRLQVRRGERSQTVELPLRQMVALPGGGAQVMLVRVDGNLQGYGPAAQLAFKEGVGHPQIFWVLKDHPELGDQPDRYRFTAEAIPFHYYSVFQVKRDPGLWWVYAGFLLVFPGFYLAFFRPAERWAVVLEAAAKKGWKVRVLGASPRHREEFAASLERLLARFAKGTPS
jgi:cytochrome c biogenesis protein